MGFQISVVSILTTDLERHKNRCLQSQRLRDMIIMILIPFEFVVRSFCMYITAGLAVLISACREIMAAIEPVYELSSVTQRGLDIFQIVYVMDRSDLSMPTVGLFIRPARSDYLFVCNKDRLQ